LRRNKCRFRSERVPICTRNRCRFGSEYAATLLGDSHTLEVKVTDTGVGIAENNLASIFEIFHQVDSSDTRKYAGVGLGLYIAKKFADLLGGIIEVESVLGKGSVFTIRIPFEFGGDAMTKAPAILPKEVAAIR